MDRREEFAIYFADQFEAFFLITNPDRFGYRLKRIIKNPLPERQWQSMLCSVDRIFVRIKFKVHNSTYVKYIVTTIEDRSQAMTVSANPIALLRMKHSVFRIRKLSRFPLNALSVSVAR